MAKRDPNSGEWKFDLNDPQLESDSIPPPPLLPAIDLYVGLPRRDTVRMSKVEVREVVGQVPDEDLVEHESEIPPPPSTRR